jgi:hypothetical protein
MAWWPFATTPEKADTMEVTGLNNYALPLYSAVIEVLTNEVIEQLEQPERSVPEILCVKCQDLTRNSDTE